MRLVRGNYAKKDVEWATKEGLVDIIDTNDEDHLLRGISPIDLINSISAKLKENVFS
jgi:hypothetical protein